MNFSHACQAITGNNTVETTMEKQEQGNCRALPYLEHDETVTVELVLAFLLFQCEELDQSVNVVLVWEEQVHLLLCGCQIFVPSIQHWLLPRRGIHFQLPGNTQSRLSQQTEFTNHLNYKPEKFQLCSVHHKQDTMHNQLQILQLS